MALCARSMCWYALLVPPLAHAGGAGSKATTSGVSMRLLASAVLGAVLVEKSGSMTDEPALPVHGVSGRVPISDGCGALGGRGEGPTFVRVLAGASAARSWVSHGKHEDEEKGRGRMNSRAMCSENMM